MRSGFERPTAKFIQFNTVDVIAASENLIKEEDQLFQTALNI